MGFRNAWVMFRRLTSRVLGSISCCIWEIKLNRQRVTILPGYTATSIGNIEFGSDVLLSHQAFLQGAGGLKFGNKIMVGPRVSFITAGHELISREATSAPIHIDDGVWIGANAVILPGVVIGKGAVVAAGAIVTKDVEPGTVVGGVPAEQMSGLDYEERSLTYFNNASWLSQF